jgi:hypothetical protein
MGRGNIGPVSRSSPRSGSENDDDGERARARGSAKYYRIPEILVAVGGDGSRLNGMNIEFSGRPGRRRNVDRSLFRTHLEITFLRSCRSAHLIPLFQARYRRKEQDSDQRCLVCFEDWHLAIAPKFAGRRDRRKNRRRRASSAFLWNKPGEPTSHDRTEYQRPSARGRRRP